MKKFLIINIALCAWFYLTFYSVSAIDTGSNGLIVIAAFWVAGVFLGAFLLAPKRFKAIKRSLLVILGGIAFGVTVPALLVIFAWVAGRYFPLYSAEFYIQELDRSLRIDLYSVSLRAEYDRYLIITDGNATKSKKMIMDTGGFGRVSVYRTPDSEVVLLFPPEQKYIVTKPPVAIIPLTLKTLSSQKNNSKDWSYLGAFDFVDTRENGEFSREYRLVRPEEQSECIPILMTGEPGGPFRTSAHRLSCERFKPDTE